MSHFNINAEDFNSWRLNNPNGLGFISWSLTQDKLNEKEYLLWSMNNYKLPVLNDDFFTLGFDQSTWNTHKDSFTWDLETIPVGNWEGITYIACTDPQKHTQIPFKHIKLLAPLTSLSTFWIKLNEAEKATPSPTAIVNSPAQTSQTVKATPEQTPSAQPPAQPDMDITDLGLGLDKSADKLKADEVTPVLNESEEEAGPSGFDLSDVVFDEAPDDDELHQLSGLDIDSEVQKLSNTNQPEPSNESLTHDIDEDSEDDLAMPAGFEADSLDVSPASKKPALGLFGASNDNQVTQPKHSPQSIVNDSPKPTSQPILPPTQNTPEPAAQVEAINNNPAQAVNTAEEEIKSSETNTNYHAFYQELENDFEKFIVLSISGGQLDIDHWSDNLHPATKVQEYKVRMNNPSIFKVVLDTKESYHGFIAESQENINFFQQWGFDELPEHATCSPIIKDGQVTGLLLCMGHSGAFNNESLEHCKKAAQSLSSIKAA